MADSLNEREFELINIIGAELGANQRDLSKQLDISLGMTNLLVRRLVAKGYIRLRQLNKKKTEYILTPKGFTEKYHKYIQGERVFLILGHSDLAELVEMSLRQPQWIGVKFSRVEQIPVHPEGVVLICREQAEEQSSAHCIDLIKELASQKNNEFEVVER